MAFVWSQRELILASSTTVIHHQLNNMVCGGKHDKKHGKRRGRRQREMVSVKSKESQMLNLLLYP